MAIQHGGVALFLLVYLYVWFKNYRRSIASMENVEKTSARDMLGVGRASQWDVLGVGLLIFLILLCMVLTCMRALSNMARGTPYDFTPIFISLSWALEDKLDYAVAAGAIVATVIIIVLSAASALAKKPVPPAESASALAAALASASYNTSSAAASAKAGARRIERFVRAMLLPPCPAATAHRALVNSSLIVSLVSLAIVVVLVYSNVDLSKWTGGKSPLVKLFANRAVQDTFDLSDFRMAVVQQH
jgi:hypothetical protein